MAEMAARWALATALALALVVAVGAAGAARAETTQQRFQDWQLLCEDGGRGCLITQTVTPAQGDVAVLAVAVGFPPGRGMPSIAFNLPPQTDPAGEMTLAVDQGQTLSLKIGGCDERVCIARATLRDEVLRQLQRGRAGLVTYPLKEGGRRVGVRLSLLGFTAAFKALQARSGR